MTVKAKRPPEMSDRHREVLGAVIDAYIATAAPVGSRTISRQPGIDVSPATIRNAMADLEAQGFLVQPHASAGRIPTSDAFRYWIDAVATPKQPGTRQRQLLHEAVLEVAGPREKLERLAEALSRLTGGAGVALTPEWEKGRLERAELVVLGESRLLLLWVTRLGAVYHREILLSERVVGDELLQAERILNAEFRGQTFDEVRRRLRQDLSDMSQECMTLLGRLLNAVDAGDRRDVIVEGVTRVVEQPDFSTIDVLRRLYEAFADRQTLSQVLERVSRSGGLQVLLNDEIGLGAARLALVASAYGRAEAAGGSIGVFGPARMAYPEILGLVRYATTLLDESLASEA